MATYKEIKGVTVQTRDEDPVVNAGSWSSGGDLNTARNQGGGAGTQTAASLFGGYATPKAIHEYYNGTSWSEQTDLNTGRASGSSGGTQTASLLAAGYTTTNVTNTETWNGSSWTETTEINTGRRGLSSLGQVNTAILAAGGYTTTAVNNVENWNGSSWTEIAEITTTGYSGSGSGTNTEGLILNVHPSSTNQYWNGSSWTELADTNVSHSPGSGASQQGSYTAALIFGGADPSLSKTEVWDGSSWTEVSDLATARRGIRGAGASTTALAMGGEVPPVSAATEEFSFPPPTAAVLTEGDLFLSGGTTLKGFGRAAGIPAGTWATSGSLNSAHGYGTGFGLQTAAVSCFGGSVPGGSAQPGNNTELYNGTSWTEVNEGNTARRNMGSSGTQTSGLAFGGFVPPSTGATEKWDGTSWTETGDIPAGYYNNRGLGTSSESALSIGGVSGGSKKADAYEFSGTSWSEITEMSTVRESGGTSNAAPTSLALAFGGESPSLTVNNEEWNGSSWTELNNMNTAKGDFGFNGISTSALAFAGSTPASPPYQQAICEFWNGTTWTELADLGTGIANGIAPAGGAVFGLASGGLTGPTAVNTGTEEWTASLANKTITAS